MNVLDFLSTVFSKYKLRICGGTALFQILRREAIGVTSCFPPSILQKSAENKITYLPDRLGSQLHR